MNPKFVTVAFLFLAACATAPAKPVETPVAAQDDYSIQIERRTDEMIASDPNAVPPGLEVTVLSVDPMEKSLFYKVQLRVPQRRGRDAQEYVIYGQCEPNDIDRCAGQIISGAKMLRR
ncbi:MAG: hypothetical protein ACM3W4_12340 [Ignavibacteriales bacterium]